MRHCPTEAYTYLEAREPGLYQTLIRTTIAAGGIIHSAPDASVWQFPRRMTRVPSSSSSNARNSPPFGGWRKCTAIVSTKSASAATSKTATRSAPSTLSASCVKENSLPLLQRNLNYSLLTINFNIPYAGTSYVHRAHAQLGNGASPLPTPDIGIQAAQHANQRGAAALDETANQYYRIQDFGESQKIESRLREQIADFDVEFKRRAALAPGSEDALYDDRGTLMEDQLDKLVGEYTDNIGELQCNFINPEARMRSDAMRFHVSGEPEKKGLRESGGTRHSAHAGTLPEQL